MAGYNEFTVATPSCERCEALKADLTLNAKMLARQTDLAREAEAEAMSLRAELEAVKKENSKFRAFWEWSRLADKYTFEEYVYV
jgi:hypothetical protein